MLSGSLFLLGLFVEQTVVANERVLPAEALLLRRREKVGEKGPTVSIFLIGANKLEQRHQPFRIARSSMACRPGGVEHGVAGVPCCRQEEKMVRQLSCHDAGYSSCSETTQNIGQLQLLTVQSMRRMCRTCEA